MIRRSLATLTIWSDTHTVDEITTRLGVRPTDSDDIGDPTRARIMDDAARRPRYEQTKWSVDADQTRVDPDDESGFGSVRVLLDTVRTAMPAIAELAASGDEVILTWSGFSDSGFGGFVLPADLMRDLGAIEAELVGTAHFEVLDEDDDEDDDEEDKDDGDEEDKEDEDARPEVIRWPMSDLRASLINILQDPFRTTAAAAAFAAAIPDLDRAFAIARRSLVDADVSDADRVVIRRAADGLLAAIPSATNPARLFLTRMLLIAETVLESDGR
ncbi:DUF4279 domain-containing protein [Curtobacterium sp. RRHDQ10]|uniref:DUF4279 domain-containing protein n=1 Tax=Curtobacterium phyllosphaerae TaxID=3413379 RepID=UPI003BF03D8D